MIPRKTVKESKMPNFIYARTAIVILAIISQLIQTCTTQSNTVESNSTTQISNSSSNYTGLDDPKQPKSDIDVTTNVIESNRDDYDTTTEQIDDILTSKQLSTEESDPVSSPTTGKDCTESYETTEAHGETESTSKLDAEVTTSTKKEVDAENSTKTTQIVEQNDEDKYITISFITNNPKKLESTTKRTEKSTGVNNESTLFKFWTTQSETNVNQRASSSIAPKQEVLSNTQFNVNFVKNNIPISGHLVTVQPLQANAFIQSKSGDDLELYSTDSVENDSDESFEEDVEDVDEESSEESESNEERYIKEAVEFGMNKMKQLYEVDEPKLYNMGLWLEADNPARYVATFNWQSEEARKYARFGYAALQASTHLKQKLNDDLEGRVAGGESNANLPRLAALKRSTLREQCPLKGIPRCPSASKRYRTHDGTCNNPRRGRWGSALTPVERFLPPAYSDGAGEGRGVRDNRLPSARLVSEHVHTGRRHDASAITHLLMQWGQFLDHDITSSSQARSFNGSVPRCCLDRGRRFVPSQFLHPECMPIEVPDDDPFYGPLGIRCLEFVRSSPAPRVDCEFGWREQMNQVTSYIDASPIYSSSARQADKLRLFRNGMLQYGRAQARRPLLPPREDDEEALCQGGAVDASCFKAGDGRVNEHPGLVAMHIIWLRKHNRLATELGHLNPHWSDEKIYQETRKIIGAFIQHITFREFLPIVLGSEVTRLFDLDLIKKGYYKSYSSKVNPSPANAFGAAAFRFGHSLVQDSFMRYDRFHRPLPNNVSLHDELTNPSNIWSFGAVDRLVLGMCNQPSQKRDEFITPELTNHLFQTSKFQFGMDLAAINIQRGRDHGIPTYVEWREPCGLTSVLDWSDLLNIMPSSTVRNLRDVYRDVDDIDLFTGGMAERPVVGGLVGPTFACIIAQQFSNLRRGDRFWYENGGFESSFTPAQLQQIRKITLAQILCQTLESIETVQPFVFLTADNLRNERLPCGTKILNNFDLTPWTERGPDLSNDINDFDRKNFIKNSLTKPNPIQKSTTQPTINPKTDSTPTKSTTSSVSNNIDDKLDFSDDMKPKINTDPTIHFITNTTDLQNLPPSSNSPSTTLTVKIDDKLDDFFSGSQKNFNKNIPNDTDKLQPDQRSFPTLKNVTQLKNFSSHLNHTDKSRLNQKDNKNNDEESSVKTLDFLLNSDSQLPFFDRLFNRQTTTEKPLTRPRPQPQIEYHHSTQSPNRYTYLINIVPKTTTPKYASNFPQKETIKITVQGATPLQIRPQTNAFPYDRRPVYDNNKLEYRPTGTFHQIVNQDPYNNNNARPQSTNSRPQFTTTYNRPQSNPLSDFPDSYFNSDQQDNTDSFQTGYNRPNRPYRPNPNDYTTEYNPFTLVTFNHVETTKRYNSFNPPGGYFTSNKVPNRPILSDNAPSYGQNSRPSNPISQKKPANTGITIYIENSPPKTEPTNSFNANSYGSSIPRPILQNSYDNEEITPLFTRPSYQRPLLNRPLTNSKPTYQSSTSFSNIRPASDSYEYEKPLQSEHGQFSNTYNSQQSIVKHPQVSTTSSKNPLYAYGSNKYPENKNPPSQSTPTKQRPTNVNINLASEYGNQQHGDISIVIDPNLQNKPQLKPQSTYQSFHKSYSTTKAPTKYFYIGNVLHKYPEDDNNPKIYTTKTPQNNYKRHQIVRENYNNIWKPDTNEHKLYYNSPDDDQKTIKTATEDESLENDKDEPKLKTIGIGRGDIGSLFSVKRPITHKSKLPKPINNKHKDQVFFDVIPSENSPMTWVTYNEKPEEYSLDNPYSIMPKIAVDPHSSKELPRPMSLNSKRFIHREIDKQ